MAEKKTKSDSAKITKVKGPYALVVYSKARKKVRGLEVPEQLFEVLELAQLPKNHRVVGNRTRITRINAKTKKSTRHYVIIKKISDNREELLKMCPIDASTEGLVSPKTQMFATEIIGKTKEKRFARKAKKIASLSARVKVEEEIPMDCGIWEDSVADPLSTDIIMNESFENLQNAAASPTPSSEFTEDSASRYPCDRIREPSHGKKNRAPTRALVEKNKVDDSRYNRFWAAMKELAEVATPQNIAFLESVVMLLKASSTPSQDTSTLQDSSSVNENKLYEIPDRYRTPGKDKVAVYDGIPFYLFSGVKSAIEAKSVTYNAETREVTKNWRVLVRECLIEVYGKHLTQFSAKGMREMQRPAIDTDLYKGLLYWARQFYEDRIDEEEYVRLINKTASNKRKAEKRKSKNRNDQEK